MNDNEIVGSEETVWYSYEAATANNVFLEWLVIELEKSGAITKSDIALTIAKQEAFNDHLPKHSPGVRGFAAFAERLRDNLALPSREQTPQP